MAVIEVHGYVTFERVSEAATAEDGRGFCIGCGHEQSVVEPDAREYPCEECGRKTVYGAYELILDALYHG